MKNIIEKFDKITKTASRSLGFKINKVEDKTPSSIIIVSTKTITKQSLNSLKKINPDALIVNAEELPKLPVFFPLYSAPNDGAASSRIRRLFCLEIS